MSARRLGSFILQNIGPILSEWQLFAKTRIPAAATMSVLDLRDHAEIMLRAIADDSRQTEAQRDNKSTGLADATDARPTAAWARRAMRHLSGFDVIQVVSEFRALRAAVLRLSPARLGISATAMLSLCTSNPTKNLVPSSMAGPTLWSLTTRSQRVARRGLPRNLCRPETGRPLTQP